MRVYSGAAIRRFANVVDKAGDTMTGALTVPTLNIVGSAASSAYITSDSATNAFVNVGGKSLMVWDSATTAARPSNSLAGQVSLGLAANRWLNVYVNTINVSSAALVSNLNADLLDGVHNGELTAKYFNYSSSSIWDCNNPTHTLHSDYGSANRNISNAPSGWSYGQLFTIFRNGNINGNLAAQFIWDAAHGTKNPGTLWFRVKDEINGWSKNWGRLAFITDNVASATKLQTARTLWGRSFDGTANVSGDMTGVGSITATGRISLSASSVLQFKEAGYGDKFGIWGDFNGYDDENRMYIGSATGAAGTDPALSAKLTMLLASGYIGLGTGSPTHRLHVNGYVRSNGLTLDGSHLLEWDAANEAWKFNGNLYATGGLSALGITELSATEASVESLKAKSILFNDSSNAFIQYIPNILWIGNMSGMIMFGDKQQSGSQIIMTNTLAFGGQKISSGSSYYIDPSGDATLKSLNVRTRITAASVAIKTSVFTVEGTEIYVTFGETKYKLVKTAVS